MPRTHLRVRVLWFPVMFLGGCASECEQFVAAMNGCFDDAGYPGVAYPLDCDSPGPVDDEGFVCAEDAAVAGDCSTETGFEAVAIAVDECLFAEQ